MKDEIRKHIFRVSLPLPIYEVIKKHKSYNLPGSSFFLNAFVDAICKAGNNDPEEIAVLLREIYIKGITIKREGSKVEAIVDSSSQTVEEKEKNIKEAPKKNNIDEKSTLKKFEENFDDL